MLYRRRFRVPAAAIALLVSTSFVVRADEERPITVHTLSGSVIEIDLADGYESIEALDPSDRQERHFVETTSGDLIEVEDPWRGPVVLEHAAEIAGGMDQLLASESFVLVRNPGRRTLFPPLPAGGPDKPMGRYFRVVEDSLVPFDPSMELHTGNFVGTTSGDHVEIFPSTYGPKTPDPMEAIAKLVGGWDKLKFTYSSFTEEGYHILRGGDVWTQGPVYRLVAGELVPLDASEPHTGHFVQTTFTTFRSFIEINPDLPLREQLDTIAPLVGGWERLDMKGGWNTRSDESSEPGGGDEEGR